MKTQNQYINNLTERQIEGLLSLTNTDIYVFVEFCLSSDKKEETTIYDYYQYLIGHFDDDAEKRRNVVGLLYK